WRPAIEVIQAMGCSTVRLAFDMDAWQNAAVARALGSCAEALAALGVSLELERWDPADGKGLDDLLAADKAPELLQGDAALEAVRQIVAATCPEEARAAELRTRVRDVLSGGGAEALFSDRLLLQALADLAALTRPGSLRSGQRSAVGCTCAISTRRCGRSDDG